MAEPNNLEIVDISVTQLCFSCAPNLEQKLSTTQGITGVAVAQRPPSLRVTYDPQRLSATNIQGMVSDIEANLQQQLRHETLTLSGLDCADCAATLERGISRLPGLRHVDANFATSKMKVGYEVATLERPDIIKRIRELGYDVVDKKAHTSHITITPINTNVGNTCSSACCSGDAHHTDDHHTTEANTHHTHPTALHRFQNFWQQHSHKVTTGIAAALWGIAFVLGYLAISPIIINTFYALSILVGGYRIARSGFNALIKGRTLGIDFLMTIAVIGAAALGEWAEGAAVVVLFALGALLESITMDRVRNSIRGLLDLSPRQATLKTATGEQRIAVEQLQIGDTVLIRPGERIPIDGTVRSGSTFINQAPITGESLPVEKNSGDDVYAGTLNEHGFIEVETTKHVEDTMLAKIISLVQEAQGSRAPAQRFIDQFAKYYTPAVVALAVLIAIIPPLLLQQNVLEWISRALVLLVIACPCALVISTPVSIVAGIGRASRMGVLIKGGAYLEAMSRIKTIAFDKTGTITQGHPTVTDIITLTDISESALLTKVAAVESRSEHPLAGAILAAARQRQLTWSEPTEFNALPGRGAQATINGQIITVGKPELFSRDHELDQRVTSLQNTGKTVLLASQDQNIIGIIAVTDQLRPEAKAAMARLKQSGIQQLIMLTGDNQRTAHAVADSLHIDDVQANLLPDQKMSRIQELASKHGSIAMVGDGINDGPALASANVGIAMGTTGSDTALETADVTLMKDDLTKLTSLIRLSKATMRTIQANVIFSIAIKVIFLALTLLGFANLWLAILADTGAALIVIANGMRLLHFKEDSLEK